MSCTVSAESILILVESKWIQTRLRMKSEVRERQEGRGRSEFLTQARKNRIIRLNGACDDEPEASRRTASANGAAA